MQERREIKKEAKERNFQFVTLANPSNFRQNKASYLKNYVMKPEKKKKKNQDPWKTLHMIFLNSPRNSTSFVF